MCLELFKVPLQVDKSRLDSSIVVKRVSQVSQNTLVFVSGLHQHSLRMLFLSVFKSMDFHF